MQEFAGDLRDSLEMDLQSRNETPRHSREISQKLVPCAHNHVIHKPNNPTNSKRSRPNYEISGICHTAP
eukprot:1364626-Amorphochlora_amoeboformis.AAC.1